MADRQTSRSDRQQYWARILLHSYTKKAEVLRTARARQPDMQTVLAGWYMCSYHLPLEVAEVLHSTSYSHIDVVHI